MRLETVQKTQSYTSPYSLDGRIPLRQAIPLGLQHVLAMFVGNLSPLLVIMATCGITDAGGFGALRIDLLQNAMLVAGLITFLQMYPIGPIGGKLPIVMGAGVLIIAGLFPKIGAVINVMPQPVLGGAAVVMFANIVISGINLITKEPLTGRNATIVSIALGLGYGIGSATAVQAFMPQWLKYVFGGSGIVPAALIAIILNIVIPKDAEKPGGA